MVFIGFLKRVIVDRHPSHRAKAITRYVQTLAGQLRLFFLPACSPELNPDEQLWNGVKINAVGPASAAFLNLPQKPTASGLTRPTCTASSDIPAASAARPQLPPPQPPAPPEAGSCCQTLTDEGRHRFDAMIGFNPIGFSEY